MCFFHHFPWCAISILSSSRVVNFRSVIFKWCVFYHFPVCAFSTFFHGVPFPVCQYPGCAFSILSFSSGDFSSIFQGVIFLPFSRVCIFHSVIFQWWFFCHFPGCDLSAIFHGVHFPFYHFPGCVISILSFSSSGFSSIFQDVIFLPFSMVCIFHSVIFQGVIFLPFSMVCNFHSVIFHGVQIQRPRFFIS